MAKEDVAALLNDMAPDDRTKFLEELPPSPRVNCSRC
jgi:Mg/Co/Ni transporter MgtE